MSTDFDTIVVGAGVVGLAIARALAGAGIDVAVLERNASIGAEVSSRNSEVIHAGLYYPPGSLRAKFCVAGKQLLYRFADETGVATRRCGKLLVATSEAELPKLQAIAKTAAANGVTDLTWLSRADVTAIEPEVSCVAALLSPSTGVIDSAALLIALEGAVTSRGGAVILNTRVERVEAVGDTYALHVVSGGEAASISARRLVLAAGLGGTGLADAIAWAAGYQAPRTYPAKGHYFALAGRQPFSHLVYPMPVGAWLGIHLTLDVSGRAKFGPDLAWKQSVDYAFGDADGARMALFEREIRRYWPGLPDGALNPDYTGIRPKIYPEGAAPADFTIHDRETHGRDRIIALYGIESPGLTSSLAIAEHVAERLLRS